MGDSLHTSEALGFTYGQSILELSYLVAAILFVFGLKMLSHPETARKSLLLPPNSHKI